MHFIISELLIQSRHFRGATRTDENDLDNFHNFFSTRPHLLVDSVVIRFDIQHDSFRVSTSSAIPIRTLTVFRFSYSSSTLAHHWLQNCASSVKHVHQCLLLHYAVSGFTCNRPTIDLLPDVTNSFSNSFASFPNSFASLPNSA